MSRLADYVLPEFDQELAATRLVLTRLPPDRFDWRPHEKSFTLGGLATHIARIPRWGRTILMRDRYDLDESRGRPADPLTSPSAVLDAYDTHVADVRRELAAASDGTLDARWTLARGETILMVMPRLLALRRFLLAHLVHHRGQLTVYLRLLDVPLPPLYGPSADESP